MFRSWGSFLHLAHCLPTTELAAWARLCHCCYDNLSPRILINRPRFRIWEGQTKTLAVSQQPAATPSVFLLLASPVLTPACAASQRPVKLLFCSFYTKSEALKWYAFSVNCSCSCMMCRYQSQAGCKGAQRGKGRGQKGHSHYKSQHSSPTLAYCLHILLCTTHKTGPQIPAVRIRVH